MTKVVIEQITDPITVASIIQGLPLDDKKIMSDCIKSSYTVWVGMIDGVVGCVWGVVLPTLLSNRAYLWLWTKDIVRDHPFVFIRRAQMIIQELLMEYEAVIGVCEVGKENSVRWLKILGAKFGDPESGLYPFEILRKAS